MKKIRFFILTVAMIIALSMTSYAGVSDYSTAEFISSDGNFKVTITGLVGVQVGKGTSSIAWLDEYGDSSLTSIDSDSIVSVAKNNKIMPIVDGGTVTITRINDGYLQLFANKMYQNGNVASLHENYNTNDMYFDSSVESFTHKFSLSEHDVNVNGDHMIASELMQSAAENFFPSGESVFTCTVSEHDAQILLAKKQADIDSAKGFEGASSWAIKELMAAEAEYIIPDAMTSGFKKATTRSEFVDLIVKLPTLIASNNEVNAELMDEHMKLKLSVLYDGVKVTDLSDRERYLYSIGEFEDVAFRNVNIPIAAKYGIVNGIVENNRAYFKPNGNITRQELCTMIVRALKVSGVKLDTFDKFIKNYEDADEIASWALENMLILNNYGIYQGSGSELMPNKLVDKETAILIAYRTLKKFKWELLDNMYEGSIIPEIKQPLEGEDYLRYEAEDYSLEESRFGSRIIENVTGDDYEVIESYLTVIENAPQSEYLTIAYYMDRIFDKNAKMNDDDPVMYIHVNDAVTKVRIPASFGIGYVTLPIKINKGDTIKFDFMPGARVMLTDYIDLYTSNNNKVPIVKEEAKLIASRAKPSGDYVIYEAEYEKNELNGVGAFSPYMLVPEDVTVVTQFVYEDYYVKFHHCPASETLGIAYYESDFDNVDSQISIYVNDEKKGMINTPKITGAYHMDYVYVDISIPEDATVMLKRDAYDTCLLDIDYIKFFGEGLKSQVEAHDNHHVFLEEQEAEKEENEQAEAKKEVEKSGKGTLTDEGNIRYLLDNALKSYSFDSWGFLFKGDTVEFVGVKKASKIIFDYETYKDTKYAIYVDDKHVKDVVLSIPSNWVYEGNKNTITVECNIPEGASIKLEIIDDGRGGSPLIDYIDLVPSN